VGHRNARLTPLDRATLLQGLLVEGWPGRDRGRVDGSLQGHGPQVGGPVPLGRTGRAARPELSPPPVPRGALTAQGGPDPRGPSAAPARSPPPGLGLGHPRSTIYAVLRREGLPRLSHLDRPTGAPVRRDERERPGEPLHIDVKKLGRIPPGGGHRIHDRGPRTGADRRRRLGYDYLHVTVEDRSRSGSTGSCSNSAPTPGSTVRTGHASGPSAGGWSSTIHAGPTPRSEVVLRPRRYNNVCGNYS
jgi:hypothetical protein